MMCPTVQERTRLWNGVSLFVDPKRLRGWPRGEAGTMGPEWGREPLGGGFREAVSVS